MAHYTPELAAKILDGLAAGQTLREVCRSQGMPTHAAVLGWVRADHDGFAAKYHEARMIGYEIMADEVIEIADDGTNDWVEREKERGRETIADFDHIARSRLRVDTRKWLLSKALPKVYADRTIVAGDAENPLEIRPPLDKFVSEFMTKRTIDPT